MSRLTLTLSDDVTAELLQAGQESSRTPEAVAEDILKRMASLRKFNRLSREVRESLGTSAPASEEEIFEQIS